MYVLVGATGHTGRIIAGTLLRQGEKVRVIGREATRLKPLADQGAETFVGSVEDAAAMTRGFVGATAVYTMVPPNYGAPRMRTYQQAVGEALATALERTHVPFVVNLSSLGAHLSEGVGPIKGLHDVEQRLNRVAGTNVLHLRPGYFMENLLWNRDLIRSQGINGTPLEGDAPQYLIATRDIAQVAAERLRRRDFTGTSVQDLLGQRDLSMNEATAILGKAIGKPDLPYVPFPYDAAEQAMRGLGFSADAAGTMIELYRWLNDHAKAPRIPRTTANTTPTSFETFAQEVAGVFR